MYMDFFYAYFLVWWQ